jgi:transposase-like protein
MIGRPMNLEKFSCPNPSCSDFGKRNAGNVSLYTRYGRKHVRLLICKTCGKTFSELKGTPFWDSRLDWDTIEKIYRSLLDGQGIRATARDHGLSKNTVKRYLRLANQDYSTVEHFLQERGVISNGNQQLRDLVDRFSSRRREIGVAIPSMM